jgi:hypothetical protein
VVRRRLPARLATARRVADGVQLLLQEVQLLLHQLPLLLGRRRLPLLKLLPLPRPGDCSGGSGGRGAVPMSGGIILGVVWVDVVVLRHFGCFCLRFVVLNFGVQRGLLWCEVGWRV